MNLHSVTIITDGEENSSKHYTSFDVALMIDRLKEFGWNFNFIGANIDVVSVASALNIDNSITFIQDEKGTDEMFLREIKARKGYYSRINKACRTEQSANFSTAMKNASADYFREDD